MAIVDRDSPCPGCYHNSKLITTCDIYIEYGKRKHWFIQPTGTPGLVACDFCSGETQTNES